MTSDKTRLGEIRGELSKTNLRVDEAKARIVENEERLQNAEAVLAEMLKLHELLQVRELDQESHSWRKNMRIYGIPEGAEGEPKLLIPFVEKLL